MKKLQSNFLLQLKHKNVSNLVSLSFSSVERSFERIPTLWCELKEIPKQFSVRIERKITKLPNTIKQRNSKPFVPWVIDNDYYYFPLKC